MKSLRNLPGGRWLLGILMAGALLYFFVRSADWGAVLDSVKAANPWLLAAVLCMQPPLFLLRAIRWQCFMAPIKKIRIQPLFSSMMIGFMISFLFPGRLGEIVRPVLLGIREKVSKTSTFATIVLERIFDMLAVLILLQAYFLLATVMPGLAGQEGSQSTLLVIRRGGFIALLVTLGAIAVMVVFKLKREAASRLFVRIAGILPTSLQRKAIHLLESFVAGLNVYHDLRTFMLIGFYSLAIWTGICFTIWVCIRAFGIGLPFLLVFPMQAILMIGVAIPTPGMVGGFHAAMKIGLVTLWGVDPSLAVSTTLVLHALLVLPAVVHGLYYAWREGFSLGEIRTIGEREQNEI